MSYLKYDGSAAAETAAPVINNFGTAGVVDTYVGTSAAESFWGGDGEIMSGGLGDDTYYLKSPLDKVVELAGAGTDKIVAWTNVYLGNFANVENLEVDGDKTYGAGNAADNIIQGGAGSQQLYGGGGQDVLIGGAGADTFIVVKGEGNDVIQDFSVSDGDVVRLTSGYTSFAQVQAHMTQVGADVKLDLGGSDGLMFRNATVGQFTAANFQLQLDTSKLGTMTFHDDFNGPVSLWDAESNPTGTWRPDFGYQGSQGAGSYTLIGNNEQEIYTSPYFRDHNGDFAVNPFSSTGDGTLTITAAPSTNSELFGYHYTSGMITTAPSFAQTYGYFEMKAELPSTAGAWPAFWLIPADGSWPPELDVMETLTGDPHADWTTEHSGVGGVHTSNGIASFIPDTASGFHTYGVLWTKTDLTWFVDGVQVFHTATPADMNKPMYMIANMALGGWSGAVDDSHMPAQMKIDYIHAYALADGSSTTVASSTAGVAATTPVTGSPPVVVASPPVAVSPPPAAGGVVLTAAGGGSNLVGGAGADTLVGGTGPDTLTGGAGADRFTFNILPPHPGHITDFTPGTDKLDFTALLKSVGYAGTDPVADGYIKFLPGYPGETWVVFDQDGHGTATPWGWQTAILDHTTASSLSVNDLVPMSGAVSPPPVVAVSPPPPPPVVVSTPSAPVGIHVTSPGFGSTLAGGAGADTLTSFQGNETMTGGAGADVFQFKTMPWNPSQITDFQLGVDKIDASGLYIDGYKGTDPIHDGHALFVSDGHGGTAVLVDIDGTATANPWATYVADLVGISPTNLTSAQVFGSASATTATPSTPTPSAATATPGVVLNSTTNFPGSVLAGGAGADTFNAGQGSDTMTGGAGADHFVFAKAPWAPAEITDFTHGQDVIDLRGMFTGSGYAGSDPVADHQLMLLDDGAGGTKVLYAGNYFLHLDHVTPATLTGSDWITH